VCCSGGNCELLSRRNSRKLNLINIDEQFFRDESGKVNTKRKKHRRQVQLAFFIYLPATGVYFVIKLARATEIK